MPYRTTLEGMLGRNLRPKARAEIEAELYGGSPLFPEAEYLWLWWCELNDARAAPTMTGPAAITYPDMDAWCRLRGIRLAPWEVATLAELDRKFRSVVSKDRPGRGPAEERKPQRNGAG